MNEGFPFRIFDPTDDVEVAERRLPHWEQAGTICFITFRTFDSIPTAVVERWRGDRMAWLRRHGIDPNAEDWSLHLRQLEPHLQEEFHRTFSQRWHADLDACQGACVLRDQALAQIVASSLRYFDGERYVLTDFVIMPNHVHLLAAFLEHGQMLAQCESWKRFSALQINRRLGQKGRFWQQDGFDHLVRSEDQFHALRRYIADNPVKARLADGEYLHESKPL